MPEGPMRCFSCHAPYTDSDIGDVIDSVSRAVVRIVYRCRRCEAEREVSVASAANVYGREIADRSAEDGARILRDQARRLEG